MINSCPPQAEAKDEAEKPSESAEKSSEEASEKVKKEGADSSEREEEDEDAGEAKTSPSGNDQVQDLIKGAAMESSTRPNSLTHSLVRHVHQISCSDYS